MKNLTNLEKKAAEKLAYQYLYGINNILLNKKFKYDARTRIGQAAAKVVREMNKNIDKQAILKLRRERSARKVQPFKSVLENSLLIDFKKNFGVKVFENRINVFGRNHWAKSAQDFRILEILLKHHFKNNG